MDNELESLLTDICSLIDSHGIVPHELTDWDKQVRQRISDYRASRDSRQLSAVPSEEKLSLNDLDGKTLSVKFTVKKGKLKVYPEEFDLE